MRLFTCLLTLLAMNLFSAETKILAFSGSVRKDSYNQKLAIEAAHLAREMGAKVTVIQLSDYPMPFYNADLEMNEGLPKNAKLLRELMIASDAIIIASPEYNHSVSGVLKNSLDWATRNEDGEFSREAFRGKKFALMSASPGKKGGKKGLVHLREIIEDAGGTVLSQTVSIPQAHIYFTAENENSELKEQISQIVITK